jgi:hypothetical protein
VLTFWVVRPCVQVDISVSKEHTASIVIAKTGILTQAVQVRKMYETVILLVLYGCETCSLILRHEHRLRVSQNRVLRGIFGPKRDEVTGGWIMSGVHQTLLRWCNQRG